jgi:hypothetical protein
MKHGLCFIQDLTLIRLCDLETSAGGKANLRRLGAASIVVRRPPEDYVVRLRIIQRPSGCARNCNYIECPACGSAVRQLLVTPATDHLQCSRCWGPSQLRYRSQERRRLPAP